MPKVPGISPRMDSAAVLLPHPSLPDPASAPPRGGPAADLASRKAPGSESPGVRQPTQFMGLGKDVLSLVARNHLSPGDALRLGAVNKGLRDMVREAVGDPLAPLKKAIGVLHQLPVGGGHAQVKELMTQFAEMMDKAADRRELRATTIQLYGAMLERTTPIRAESSPERTEFLMLFIERIDRFPADEQAQFFDGLLHDTLTLFPADVLKPLQALARQLAVCPPELRYDNMFAIAHQNQNKVPSTALSSPEQAQLLLTLAGEIGSMVDPSRACNLLKRAVRTTVPSPVDRLPVWTELSRQAEALNL